MEKGRTFSQGLGFTFREKLSCFYLEDNLYFLNKGQEMIIILTQKEIHSYITAACPFGIYFVVCTEHKMYSMITRFKQLIYLTGIDL
jgi:hypothetical protein